MASEPDIKIRVDAFGDWGTHTRGVLAEAGFTGFGDVRDIAIAWFNLRRRSVEPRSRRTVYANEFRCPTAFATPLATLISDSENGRSLVKYLSRTLATSPTYSDGLLNDWQIHHFHLGSNVEADGFVTRTNELLFAVVVRDVFYAVDVGNHDDFSRDELFSRIASNWPDLVNQRRMPAAALAQQPLAEKVRKRLRKANLYPPTVVGDDAFVPASGGAVMAGTSVEVLMEVQQLYHFLNTVQAFVEQEASAQIRDRAAAGHQLGPEVELRLSFEDGVVATHVESGYSLDVLAGLRG